MLIHSFNVQFDRVQVDTQTIFCTAARVRHAWSACQCCRVPKGVLVLVRCACRLRGLGGMS